MTLDSLLLVVPTLIFAMKARVERYASGDLQNTFNSLGSRNDPREGLACPNHTANLLGPPLGHIEFVFCN